ncbi:hypothetical protein C9374_010701 [Naegleria lovaniensis]|uniref:PPPDE domain-containing protein n=1 Tax=Naegleria lovaniensis TaxID=51637 RepID=A0AA88GB26_NAELO|nr:uncharacterized protein C9374_010701 [Naegleria lovaniensis]KAG2374417.1 hypothetical protein C9374_010701 [Naegleria lovaniensis]
MLSSTKPQTSSSLSDSDEHLKVYLNVYDLQKSTNVIQHSLGLGSYHSGVVIRNTEYTFSADSGVFSHKPKDIPATFLESIYMGKTEVESVAELNEIINELKKEFKPSEYNPLKKNCNHFSNALCQRLLDGKTIPGWVNRSAGIGSFFSRFLPKSTEKNLIESSEAKQIMDSVKMEKYENENIYTSLNNIVNMSAIECLNQRKPNIVQNMFEMSDKKYLESDADEQLIIRIPFKTPVNITAIILKATNKLKCPREILLFTKTGMIVDFDNAESVEPTQVIEIDPDAAVNGVAIPLKIVKFKNVNMLQLFVSNNYGDNTTIINHLNIIGKPVATVDLNKLQQNAPGCSSCSGGGCCN